MEYNNLFQGGQMQRSIGRRSQEQKNVVYTKVQDPVSDSDACLLPGALKPGALHRQKHPQVVAWNTWVILQVAYAYSVCI